MFFSTNPAIFISVLLMLAGLQDIVIRYMDRFAREQRPLCLKAFPVYPDAGRFWDIIDKYQVNIFYTAPTAIRSLMGFGTEPLKDKNLKSLRVLGTVGEPINEEAWHWYDDHIGK